MMDKNNYPTREDVVCSQYMAGRVKRYHTWPTIHQETVAEHSFCVLQIYRQIFGLSSMSVVKVIMDHDLPEVQSGDLPFPIKRRYPKLAEILEDVERDARKTLLLPTEYSLAPKEGVRIKVCDLLQMWQFGRAEMRMGNSYAMAIITDTAKDALALADEHLGEEASLVRRWMQDESNR